MLLAAAYHEVSSILDSEADTPNKDGDGNCAPRVVTHCLWQNRLLRIVGS